MFTNLTKTFALFATLSLGTVMALHAQTEVVAVVCQPDKPSGRGLEVKPVPVKARALELGLHVRERHLPLLRQPRQLRVDPPRAVPRIEERPVVPGIVLQTAILGEAERIVRTTVSSPSTRESSRIVSGNE